jgi:hypothetical protein
MALLLRACICLWRLLLVISHPRRRHDNETIPKKKVTLMKASTCQKRDLLCSPQIVGWTFSLAR